MLKIKSNNGVVKLDVNGDPVTIIVDLICAIKCLYDRFAENGAGESFRNCLTEFVNDGSAFTKDGKPETLQVKEAENNAPNRR